MDTNHAPAACPNPACECDPCHCARPCTCGLVATQYSTHETWDPVRNEYRHIEIQTFRPTGQLGASSHGGHHDSATSHGGDQGHGGHGGHGDHGTPAAELDQATYDVRGVVARFDPDGQAMTELTRRADQVANQHHDHESMSVRAAEHNGHTIKIVTKYELLIDDQPLTGHMGVNADGTVHYHGIPNYSTESAVDLAKQIVDSFPDDYARPKRPGTTTHESGTQKNGAD